MLNPRNAQPGGHRARGTLSRGGCWARLAVVCSSLLRSARSELLGPHHARWGDGCGRIQIPRGKGDKLGERFKDSVPGPPVPAEGLQRPAPGSPRPPAPHGRCAGPWLPLIQLWGQLRAEMLGRCRLERDPLSWRGEEKASPSAGAGTRCPASEDVAYFPSCR